MKQIAQDVTLVTLKIANVYLVGNASRWFLVDSGMAGDAAAIKKAVDAKFGSGAKPQGIVLTHGHPDHAGCAQSLGSEWGAKVYAPSGELPFLTGKAQYPPPDVTAPGFLSFLSRFVKPQPITLTPAPSPIDHAEPFPGIPGWQAIEVPGHTPGQLAFFRSADKVLLAGDAFTTVDSDSAFAILTKSQKLCRPPAPSTMDWQEAQRSVAKLAALHPSLLAAGHGQPLSNNGNKLQTLADTFPFPKRGRFAQTPAKLLPDGALEFPPTPPDFVPHIAKSVLVAGLAVGIGAIYRKVQKHR